MELLEIDQELDGIQGRLSVFASVNNAHSIAGQIAEVFKKRDIDMYCRLVSQTQDLYQKAITVQKKRQTISKLKNEAPQLADTLICCREPCEWSKRLKKLNMAWAWARAKSWLDDFLSTDAESLERQSNRLEQDINSDLAELASLKGWYSCFSRMQEDHRRNLIGWQDEMKLGGGFTGKHAPTHRQNAQQHLNKCREVVPAWIMPTHRIYDTVEAGAGIFDIIIVDEASQCGPEDLPLFYLGKRILVIGDDQQISPEAVGVDREQVQRLMRKYLYDFEHADSFGVLYSLFNHGRRRFSNRITLREHFRCMPEIINFSNDLCYQANPLIPLRQYVPGRLEPLKAVYIENGYREGAGQRVINRPEAEALVEAVVNCCRDQRYQGMSMGVISLQGEAQGYLIADILLKRLGAEEMEKRRLICGNPYSFQGDERDVIFLSMVAAPNERIGTLTIAADQRRFNVAASRAKDQMWLFHSVTSNHLSKDCFRRKLLDYFQNNPLTRITQPLGELTLGELRERAFRANRSIEKPSHPFESWFEVDVALAIANRGYRVVPQFEFAGKRIDLVVQGGKTQLAVECDGDFWHGADEYASDTEREEKLKRCGWRFFRIRESYYYANPEKALESLWEIMHKMGIGPVGADSESEINSQDQYHGINKKEPVSITEDRQDENANDIFKDQKHESAQMGETVLVKKEEDIPHEEIIKSQQYAQKADGQERAAKPKGIKWHGDKVQTSIDDVIAKHKVVNIQERLFPIHDQTQKQERSFVYQAAPKAINDEEGITVQDLANKLQADPAAVIKKLVELGILVTLNQAVDHDIANLIIQEFDTNADIGKNKETVIQETNPLKCPEKAEESFDLINYLIGQGLEVIDRRSKGGALWIVGEKEELSLAINFLRSNKIYFTFSQNGGKATKYRPAWFYNK